MGGLQLSFFQQSKYLIPKVNISIKLTRAKRDFCFMNFGDVPFKFVIESAVLFVRRVFVAPSILKAHEDGLKVRNAIYPLQKIQISNYTLSKGSVTDSRELIMSGETPKLVVIGMVDNSAFNGDFKKNPFNFQHFNLSFISLKKNGESVPLPPLQLDFKKDIDIMSYMQMIQNLEYFLKDESNSITHNEFKHGSTLFVYNLTPDLNFGGSCAQRFDTSNLRLDIKFDSALSTSINIVVFYIIDGQIEITGARDVLKW
jgi:hypothetical protein